MRRQHSELLATTGSSLHTNPEYLISEPVRTQAHTLHNADNMYQGSRKSKHRQHLCKVCLAMATKRFESSYAYPQCIEAYAGYVPMSNRVRREESANALTCSQMLRQVWCNRSAIPEYLKKRND
ncbi:hypothetical protein PI125_g19366 [Phytophthora idaei]|nr:hypothetical protein PI125_g19366 [Phytophthora idaei]KAG3155424.1 hypothetical protein PI126_g9164 [Phytophthora idaei]